MAAAMPLLLRVALCMLVGHAAAWSPTSAMASRSAVIGSGRSSSFARPSHLATQAQTALPRGLRSGHIVACDQKSTENKIPFILDIGTKGGVVFYTFVGIILPFLVYSFLLDTLEMDVVTAGNIVLVGYVGLSIVAWTARCERALIGCRRLASNVRYRVVFMLYVFRVANKDMTYAKQLRDYENAVIQKRFEELNNDEVDALMGEIYPGKPASSDANVEKKPKDA
eukprot:6213358-Pleurochrysis_carterae.AAC.2